MAQNAIEPMYSFDETGKESMPGLLRVQGEKTRPPCGFSIGPG